jgi:hypothetical protein
MTIISLQEICEDAKYTKLCINNWHSVEQSVHWDDITCERIHKKCHSRSYHNDMNIRSYHDCYTMFNIALAIDEDKDHTCSKTKMPVVSLDSSQMLDNFLKF